MHASTITSKGQVTIPKDIRDEAHLRQGDRVLFHVRDDGVSEVGPASIDVLTWAGSVRSAGSGVRVEDMNDTIRDAGGGA